MKRIPKNKPENHSEQHGLVMKYFVLKPRSSRPDDDYAFASRHAMRAYANAIATTNRQLAEDLQQWARTEQELATDLTCNREADK